MHSGRSTAFLLLFEIFTAALYREVHLVEGAAIPGSPPLWLASKNPGGFRSTGKSTWKRSCVMAAFKARQGRSKVDLPVWLCIDGGPSCMRIHGGPPGMTRWTCAYGTHVVDLPVSEVETVDLRV